MSLERHQSHILSRNAAVPTPTHDSCSLSVTAQDFNKSDVTVCIMYMDDNADATRILLASPPADWRRQLGRPCITWLSTVQQDLKQHHLMLPEPADLAQNRPLWRMMSTYGATQL